MSHWAMPGDLKTLCGSTSKQRCTAVRLVTCRFCLNCIDSWLHKHMPEAPVDTAGGRADGK